MGDLPKPHITFPTANSSTESKSPILLFNLAAEAAQLSGEDSWRNGRISKALVKYADFRVVLMLMKSGAIFDEHKSPGRISVEVLSGHVQMRIGKTLADLPAGHLLALDREVQHDVQALEASALLLTIALPEGSGKL